MKKIIIEIHQDGKIVVEAQGFKGRTCIDDLKWLDELLGRPDKRVFKDEYHKVEGIKVGVG